MDPRKISFSINSDAETTVKKGHRNGLDKLSIQRIDGACATYSSSSCDSYSDYGTQIGKEVAKLKPKTVFNKIVEHARAKLQKQMSEEVQKPIPKMPLYITRSQDTMFTYPKNKLISVWPSTLVFRFMKGALYMKEVRVTNVILEPVYFKVIGPKPSIRGLCFSKSVASKTIRIPPGLTHSFTVIYDSSVSSGSAKASSDILSSRKRSPKAWNFQTLKLELEALKKSDKMLVESNPSILNQGHLFEM